MLLNVTTRLFHAFRRNEDGQDLLEYALLAALIVLVAIGTVTTLGTTINTVFWETIANAEF